MPLGDKPVAVYWDEPGYRWAPQNPDLYRLPKQMPSDGTFETEFAAWKAAYPAGRHLARWPLLAL